MIIRKETPADYEAVYELVKAAFAAAEHSDGREHELVAALRKSGAFVPGAVARRGDGRNSRRAHSLHGNPDRRADRAGARPAVRAPRVPAEGRRLRADRGGAPCGAGTALSLLRRPRKRKILSEIRLPSRRTVRASARRSTRRLKISWPSPCRTSPSGWRASCGTQRSSGSDALRRPGKPRVKKPGTPAGFPGFFCLTRRAFGPPGAFPPAPRPAAPPLRFAPRPRRGGGPPP